jgi:SOS-response transcriptional repressor LexA
MGNVVLKRKDELSRKQADVVRAVYHLTAALGRGPRQFEILNRLGLTANQSNLNQILSTLALRGVVRWRQTHAHSLELTGASWGASEHGSVYAADTGTPEGRRLALVLASGGKAA